MEKGLSQTRHAVIVDTPRNCGRVLSLFSAPEKSAGSTTVADYGFDIINPQLALDKVQNYEISLCSISPTTDTV